MDIDVDMDIDGEIYTWQDEIDGHHSALLRFAMFLKQQLGDSIALEGVDENI